MFLTPRGADFWRPWIVAALLSAMAIAAFAGIDRAHAEVVRASFYGAESGRRNADGSRFDGRAMTAAHRTFPFGTRLDVCLARCAIVTVRDRGPAAWTGRALDLARGAARAIGLERVGVAAVRVTVVGRATPRHGRRR